MMPVWLSDEYRNQHIACPKCGSGENIETTCMVSLGDINRNRASCVCGWTGIVDDMVSLQNELTTRPATCTRRRSKPFMDDCDCDWCQQINSEWMKGTPDDRPEDPDSSRLPEGTPDSGRDS